MNCSHCGKTLGSAAKFCNGCGAVQSPSPAPDVLPEALICAKCKVLCASGTKFCLACGHKHGTPLADAEVVSPPVPPANPEPSLSGTAPEASLQDPAVPVAPAVSESAPQPESAPVHPTAAAPQEPDQTAAQTANVPSDVADQGPATAPEVRNEGSAVPPPAQDTPPQSTHQGTDQGADQGLVIDPPIVPTTSAKPYIRWAIAAVFVVLVAGLAWMALKPGAAPKAEKAATTDSGTPAQVQDDSHDDRAKAGSLVGPAGQGAMLPAARTPDASPAPVEVAPAVAPIVAPAAVAPVAPVAPAPTARPAEPSKPAASKPTPAKPAPQKAKPSTLNDLLD